MANVHLDATEHQDHVVFLHHIQEGPANRSYGLQVAKLAGIPGPVLQAAGEKLRELEEVRPAEVRPAEVRPAEVRPAGGHRHEAAGPAEDLGAGAGVPAQVDLFADPHPVVAALEQLDVDELTPRQALEMLYELKSRLE